MAPTTEVTASCIGTTMALFSVSTAPEKLPLKTCFVAVISAPGRFHTASLRM